MQLLYILEVATDQHVTTFTMTAVSGNRADTLMALANKTAAGNTVGVFYSVQSALEALESYLNLESSK